MMLVRDRADLLGPAIDSVLAQTEGDFELIIIDDASSDDSLAVARERAAADERIRVYANETPLGIPRSRNRALELARGDFLAICDSDDLSTPDRFARHSALLLADERLGGWVGPSDASPNSRARARFRPGTGVCATGGRSSLSPPRCGAPKQCGRSAVSTPASASPKIRLGVSGRRRGYRLLRDDVVAVHYRVHPGNVTAQHARSRQVATPAAQLRGLVLLRGRWTPRGYAVLGQSILRIARPPR